MAAPPEHPTWIETILGGGLITVLLPRIMDAIRGTVLRRRKDDAVVRVAEIEDDAKFRTDLLARVAQLEASQTAKDERLAHVESDMRVMRLQIESILSRGEAALGGEPAELLAAMRTMVYELRTALGHDAYPKSVVIGDRERTQGSGE